MGRDMPAVRPLSRDAVGPAKAGLGAKQPAGTTRPPRAQVRMVQTRRWRDLDQESHHCGQNRHSLGVGWVRLRTDDCRKCVLGATIGAWIDRRPIQHSASRRAAAPNVPRRACFDESKSGRSVLLLRDGTARTKVEQSSKGRAQNVHTSAVVQACLLLTRLPPWA